MTAPCTSLYGLGLLLRGGKIDAAQNIVHFLFCGSGRLIGRDCDRAVAKRQIKVVRIGEIGLGAYTAERFAQSFEYG